MSFEASEEKNYTYPHDMSLSMVTWTVLIKIVSTAGTGLSLRTDRPSARHFAGDLVMSEQEQFV